MKSDKLWMLDIANTFMLTFLTLITIWCMLKFIINLLLLSYAIIFSAELSTHISCKVYENKAVAAENPDRESLI